ncbi:DUF6348 family protein [soil metagenome]
MAFSIIQRFFRRIRRPAPLATSEDATNVFLELFRGHGLSCHIENGWIVADSACVLARATILPGRTTPQFTVQLDVDAIFPSGARICESCAGIGLTLHDAIGESIVNFCNGPFHVIYSAATGQPCSHCDNEEWMFGSDSRRVLISPVVTRGLSEENQSLSQEWFSWVANQLPRGPLSEDMHWFRLFHGQFPGGVESEALVNNEPSADLQYALDQYPWPVAQGYYSVRIFLIILGTKDQF